MIPQYKSNSAATVSGVNIHVYPSALTNDSRITRITKSIDQLNLFDAVWTIGVHSGDLPEAEQIDKRRWRIRIRSPRMPFKLLGILLWSCLVIYRLRGVRVSCVNCHSLPVLPLCVLLKLIKRAKLIYDTHELETETFYCRGVRQLVSKIMERMLIPFADEVCVVTQSIADWYAKKYDLARVWLVRNVPAARRPPNESIRPLRQIYGVPSDALLFIYQGLVCQERGCGKLLNAFAKLSDKRHLLVMGNGPEAGKVEAFARNHANIHYHPAVPIDRVLNYTAAADVGIFLLPMNSCLSYQFSLGNKFFEYLTAGLAVIVSDNPEMAGIVRRHRFGWVHRENEGDIASLIDQISRADVDEKQSRAREAVNAYTWENEEQELRAMYSKVFGSRAVTIEQSALQAA